MAFHALVRDFLTIRTPRMDPEHPDEQLMAAQDDGSLAPVFDSRPARRDELERADIYAMGYLHNMATSTEKLYLGGAADRAREYREQQGSGSEMTILGPEAIREMGIKIGTLVEKLSESTERKRVQRRLEVIESETAAAAEPLYNADDHEPRVGGSPRGRGVMKQRVSERNVLVSGALLSPSAQLPIR